ncbi:MAG: GNAT family N-acetyltransferase [Actinomycetota bacterium]
MTDLEGLTSDQLRGGFFAGWPNPPSPETHLRILGSCDYKAIAIDDLGRVVGFATAISDHVLTAYITLLEVLPEMRGRGIGTTLINRLIDAIGPIHRIDLLCDPELSEFYRALGFDLSTGMYSRDYTMQTGRGWARFCPASPAEKKSS